jgi:micrococcal nuclease
LLLLGCPGPDGGGDGGGGDHRCGPTTAEVARVIDGDTIELAGGERVRYLMIDAPEITFGKDECYGQEAFEFNRSMVEGKTVTLAYDEVCRDKYDRLLAYVSAGSHEVNRLMVHRGFACVLHIPPNGADRRADFLEAQEYAQGRSLGLWGAACEGNRPCR